MSDSGPNLGVRGVGCLIVFGGVLLMDTGYRIRRGTSRISVPPSLSIYGFGVFIMSGAAAVLLGAILIGIGI